MVEQIVSCQFFCNCFFGAELLQEKDHDIDLPNKDIVLIFNLGFFFHIFISTPLSKLVWELVPGLSTTLFPWRWLMISTFAIAALIGISFDTLSFTDIKKDRTTRVATAVFLCHPYCQLFTFQQSIYQ